MIQPLVRIPVAILVERRNAASPWIDFVWRPVGALVGEPAAAPWTMLSEANDATVFYAGTADVELYRTETGNYRDNLATENPALWVVLRPTGSDPAYEVVRATADPTEGEAFTEAGGDIVERVAMPPEMCAVVEAFVAEHHVERAFLKRKRDRAAPDVFSRREGHGDDE